MKTPATNPSASKRPAFATHLARTEHCGRTSCPRSLKSYIRFTGLIMGFLYGFCGTHTHEIKLWRLGELLFCGGASLPQGHNFGTVTRVPTDSSPKSRGVDQPHSESAKQFISLHDLFSVVVAIVLLIIVIVIVVPTDIGNTVTTILLLLTRVMISASLITTSGVAAGSSNKNNNKNNNKNKSSCKKHKCWLLPPPKGWARFAPYVQCGLQQNRLLKRWIRKILHDLEFEGLQVKVDTLGILVL